jgi:DNA-binding transcriptional ArsR family regulator
LSDDLGQLFGALADPTRRLMVETLLRDGSTSVPALCTRLPITRQAIAKHIATLDHAGLIERSPGPGREVRYRLRADALAPATAWLRDADAAWAERLARLKSSVEDERETG